MLAEARVRLANTKGKKAKRKAREKMIEESRRLAHLQKRRELKAAGIEFDTKQKSKGLNYNAEVPFERKVPNFAVMPSAEEEGRPDVQLSNVSLQQLEGQGRSTEEERLKKIDAKKMKKLKERELPIAVEKMNKQNEIFIEKTKLILPEPQLQDQGLEAFAKLKTMQGISEHGNAITRDLVGGFSQREAMTPTPMRTPMV